MDLDGVGAADDPAIAMLAADVASAQVGVRPLEVRRGYARVALTVTAEHCNGHGIGHGGFVFLLADTAFAAACNSGRTATVAQTAEVDFVAAVRPGDELVAEAVERHAWGRSGITDVTVTRGDGELVAVFRGRSRTLRT